MSGGKQDDSLKIIGGTLFDGAGKETENPGLLIRGGKVAAMGASARRASAEQEADAAGCVIAPGCMDLCCNLRERANGPKGNIATQTLAADHGGFTTGCASPETSPVNDCSAVTHLIREGADSRGAVRVLPIGAITRGLDGEMLSDMAGLKNAGCVAVGNGSRGVRNARILRRCMAYAQTFGL